MTAALVQTDPTYWPCEYCRADGGQPCRSARGPIRNVHASRRLAVELWKRYGIPRYAHRTDRVTS